MQFIHTSKFESEIPGMVYLNFRVLLKFGTLVGCFLLNLLPFDSTAKAQEDSSDAASESSVPGRGWRAAGQLGFGAPTGQIGALVTYGPNNSHEWEFGVELVLSLELM